MDNFANLVQTLLFEKENFFKRNKNDEEDLSTFLNKRSKGAEKIQKAAENKGGFSLLTAVHFKAKEIPYNNCKKHLMDKNSDYIKQKANECFDKLKKWDKMSQREFQHVMGQLEAYGEVYIRSIENKGE